MRHVRFDYCIQKSLTCTIYWNGVISIIITNQFIDCTISLNTLFVVNEVPLNDHFYSLGTVLVRQVFLVSNAETQHNFLFIFSSKITIRFRLLLPFDLNLFMQHLCRWRNVVLNYRITKMSRGCLIKHFDLGCALRVNI